MSIPTIVVTGTYKDAAGDADADGYVTFQLNTPLHDAVGNVVATREVITSQLNASGQITDTDGTTVGITLYCTSGGDIQPTSGVVYQVHEKIGGLVRTTKVALPSSLGATVDIADLVPVTGNPNLVWTVPDLTAEQVYDAIGDVIVAGAGLTETVDDAANTVTLAAEVTQQELDDEAAARVAGDAASVATAASDATTKANAAQAAAVQRANHTGTQPAATISDFDSAAVAAGSGTYVALADVKSGAGTPEGSVTGTPGQMYRDTTNGLLYVKQTGSGNTGWKVVPFGEQTASIEDLVASSVLTTGTVTNTAAYPIFTAQFPCRITSCSVIIYETAGIAADSDTIYWSVEVRRARAGSEAVIATKTTKLTGGEAVGLRTDWNFDAATFDPTNKVLAKGDIVNVAFNETGTTPVGWAKPMATVRYEPI